MLNKNYCKEKLAIIVRFCLKVMYIFPIKKNNILFISYNGTQVSCNPKYIAEYLKSNYPNKYKLIWAVSDKEKFKDLNENGYELVQYNSLDYIYTILTSKVVITNVTISSHIPLRKKQYIINTWHGGGAYKRSILNENKISKVVKDTYASKFNLYLSSCKRFSDMVIRGTFGFEGDILEVGLPRNDIFFSSNKIIKEKIMRKYSINNKKILLYAPTFRDINKNVTYEFDYERVLEALEKSFAGQWILLVRMHHFIKDRCLFDFNDNRIIDVSQYPDMQELLYTSDVLITDYSSCIWDFSLMKKPCFLYTTDLNSYKKERDFYIDINKWHFPLCQNSDELVNSILNYNEKEYNNNINLHHTEWGSYENGKATKKVVEKILSLK